jgi:hypothetical protein
MALYFPPAVAVLVARFVARELAAVRFVRLAEARAFISLQLEQGNHLRNAGETIAGGRKGGQWPRSKDSRYKSRRPSMDLRSVTSSAYSMSMPTGMP